MRNHVRGDLVGTQNEMIDQQTSRKCYEQSICYFSCSTAPNLDCLNVYTKILSVHLNCNIHFDSLLFLAVWTKVMTKMNLSRRQFFYIYAFDIRHALVGNVNNNSCY